MVSMTRFQERVLLFASGVAFTGLVIFGVAAYQGKLDRPHVVAEPTPAPMPDRLVLAPEPDADVLGPERPPVDIQSPRVPRPTLSAVAKALKLGGLKCAVVQDGPSMIEGADSAQAEKLLGGVERAWGISGHLYCVPSGP